MGARGQRATTIEARSGMLRHLRHGMEAELKKFDMPLVFARLLHEALFAAGTFTFYDEVSPYSPSFGRQPAMLSDLPVLGHGQPTETLDHVREQEIRFITIVPQLRRATGEAGMARS
eukprot:5105398-Pyramimonas_sp.AAC.1